MNVEQLIEASRNILALSNVSEEDVATFIAENGITNVDQLTQRAIESFGEGPQVAMPVPEIVAVAGKAERKVRAKKEPSEKAATPRVKKEKVAHEAGPRGFRFGGKWNESVKAAAGLAVDIENRPKLLAHATATLGTEFDREAEAAVLCAMIAATFE